MIDTKYKENLKYFIAYVGLIMAGMIAIKYYLHSSVVSYYYQDWVYLFYNPGNKFHLYFYLYFVALTWLAVFIWQLRMTCIDYKNHD